MRLHWNDSETTGLSKDINEIVQLSGIIEHDGEVIEEYDIFMRPDRPKNVDEGALRAQNRTLAQLMAFPERRLGIEEFADLLDRYGMPPEHTLPNPIKHTWVGQNPEFDRGFVRVMLTNAGVKTFGDLFEPVAIDLVTVAREAKRKGFYRGENCKLPTICRELGIDYLAHDSLEDIRATREAMRKFSELFQTPTHVRRQLAFLPEERADE